MNILAPSLGDVFEGFHKFQIVFLDLDCFFFVVAGGRLALVNSPDEPGVDVAWLGWLVLYLLQFLVVPHHSLV